MNLYNTHSQRLEQFVPRGQTVSVYVCGITPYDTTHLGHAFTYVSFDVLIRYLEMQGLTVLYVQNVTDVDDDILRKAKEVGEDWKALRNQWTAHFIRDMQALNVRPPDHYPKATDAIYEIIASVKKLIEAGVAYESGGSVYYQVDKRPEFGELSHLPKPEMLTTANERGNNPEDPNKRDPLDFVLWQAQAPGEPAWESPWGMGRPGWHIECSTMSARLLGKTVDIHGGGSDLIFPHHECEIAQSEVANHHHPFVRYWLHTAMVQHEGQKMSKSLGNLVMVKDLLQTWSPDALRLYMSGHHYREVWSYNADELAEAAGKARQILEAVTLNGGSGPELDPASARASFVQAMEDDLNTKAAIEDLISLSQDIKAAAKEGNDVTAAQETLRELSGIFGLQLDAKQPEAHVISGWVEHLKRFH